MPYLDLPRLCVAFGAAAFTLGASAGAHAERVGGALQLGASATLLSHSSTSTERSAGGVTEDQESSETTWGLGRSDTAVELGIAIDDLVVGGFAQLGGTSVEADPDGLDLSGVRFAIGPKADYMFMPDAQLRPFVGALLGLVSNSSEANLHVGNASVRDEFDAWGYLIGIRGGARYFLVRGLSIDPALTLSYAGISGEGEQRVGAIVTDDERELGVFTIGLGVAASGWFL